MKTMIKNLSNYKVLVSFSLRTLTGTALLVLSGCGSDLQVISKDMSTTPSQQISITLTFNKSVDRSSVIPGTSLILAGGNNPNAPGVLTWGKSNTRAEKDTKLTFVSNAVWGQIAGPGGTDTGVTLTLKSTVKAHDRSSIEQCKTGKPGTEPPGDCVLYFVIPG